MPKNYLVQLGASRDVASAIGVSATTVSRWARAGIIPSIRISARCIRFDLNAVLKAIALSKKNGAINAQ